MNDKYHDFLSFINDRITNNTGPCRQHLQNAKDKSHQVPGSGGDLMVEYLCSLVMCLCRQPTKKTHCSCCQTVRVASEGNGGIV